MDALIIVRVVAGGSFLSGFLLFILFVGCVIILPFLATVEDEEEAVPFGIIASLIAFIFFLNILNDFYIVRNVAINPFTGGVVGFWDWPSTASTRNAWEQAGGTTWQYRTLPILSSFWSFILSLVLLAIVTYSRKAFGLPHVFHYIFLVASVLILFLIRSIFGV